MIGPVRRPGPVPFGDWTESRIPSGRPEPTSSGFDNLDPLAPTLTCPLLLVHSGDFVDRGERAAILKINNSRYDCPPLHAGSLKKNVPIV